MVIGSVRLFESFLVQNSSVSILSRKSCKSWFYDSGSTCKLGCLYLLERMNLKTFLWVKATARTFTNNIPTLKLNSIDALYLILHFRKHSVLELNLFNVPFTIFLIISIHFRILTEFLRSVEGW